MSLMLPYTTQAQAVESIIGMPLSMPQGNTCTAKDDCGQHSSTIPNEHRKNLGFSVSLRQVEAVIVALRYDTVFRDGVFHTSFVAQDPILPLCAYAPSLPMLHFLGILRPDLDIIAANIYQG